MLFLAIGVSLVVERKFGVVHLERLFPFVSVAAAIGLSNIASLVARWWRTSPRLLQAFIGIPVIAVAVLLSPLPRFLSLLPVPWYAIADHARYNSFFQRPAHNVLHRRTLLEITSYISTHSRSADRVLVLSSCMSQLYVLLRQPLWNHFSTTLPIYATHVPAQWKQLYYRDLESAQWLVVSTLDRAPELFGHSKCSYESLWSDRRSAAYVRNHFQPVMETDIAIVYHRTRSNVSPPTDKP